jgi:tetratricopeptide (TPR) repeat protein
MPIRRPRSPKPALRHLAFLETMADSDGASPIHRGAHASLLTLRLLDHWIALGAEMARPDATAHRATRDLVTALQDDAEMQSALGAIIDAIEALQEPDAQPVLPRVYALGMLFEQRGLLAQAGDGYATVARHVDSAAHLDLAFDAHMRHGYCLRHSGEFEWADQAYANAGMLATRDRDRIRVILSRLGRAKVVWDRGNLPEADVAIAELLREPVARDSAVLRALLLHDRAGLAWARQDRPNAIRWVHEAFRVSPDEYDRERMLVDLANFLSKQGAFESANDALRVLEASARSQSGRWHAKIDLMDLAYRSNNEVSFEQLRRDLADQPLPPVQRVSYLLDLGKGCTVFGQYSDARAALDECTRLATNHGLNQRVFQAEDALRALDAAERNAAPPVSAAPVQASEVPDEVAQSLRKLLQEVSGAPA